MPRYRRESVHAGLPYGNLGGTTDWRSAVRPFVDGRLLLCSANVRQTVNYHLAEEFHE